MKKSIIVLLCAVVLTFTACGKESTSSSSNDGNNSPISKQDKEDSSDDSQEGNAKVFDNGEQADEKLVSNAVLEIDGKKLNFPCTIKQLKEIGFEQRDKTSSMIEPDGINQGQYFYYENKDTEIVVRVENTTDAPQAYEDCFVVDFSTTSDRIAINGIRAGKSTYKDVLDVYGLSHSTQESDFEKEVVRASEYVLLQYRTDSIKNYLNDANANFVGITHNFTVDKNDTDFHGKVNEIAFEVILED